MVSGKHRRRTVAFMGLDGTGKSTQAQLLWEHASAVGKRWAIVHHSSTKLPVLAGLKQHFHRRVIELLKRRRVHVAMNGHDTRGHAVVAREPPVYGGGTALSWIISVYLVLGSLMKAVWYRWRFLRVTGLIFDRCFVDDLVKAQWRFGCRFPGAGILLRIAPKPNIVLVLTGEPQTTYGRKKDQNCTYGEYLRKKEILDRWLTEAAARGWNVQPVIVDGRSVADVHRTVVDILAVRYGRCSDVDPRSGRSNAAIQS
jgi:thymidylate kinase